MGQMFPICIPMWSVAYAWQDLCVLCIQCSILSQTSSFLELFPQQPTQWEDSWKQPELSLTFQPLTDFPWLFCYTRVFFPYTNQHCFWTTINNTAPEQIVIHKELIETYSISHLQKGITSYSHIRLKHPIAVEILKKYWYLLL